MRRFGRAAIVEAIRGTVGRGATSITLRLSAADAMALAGDIELAHKMSERAGFEAVVVGAIDGGEA